MNPDQRISLVRRLKAAAQAVQIGRFADGELLARECSAELAEFMATSGAPTLPPPADDVLTDAEFRAITLPALGALDHGWVVV
jgi:hypothetical protein